jgi:hypothetical protein
MKFHRIVLATLLLAACGAKQPAATTPTAGGTPVGPAAPAADTSTCQKFVADMTAHGETSMVDTTTKPALREAHASCQATVKNASGFTCHLATFDTPELAAAAADDVGKTFWVVPQSDGKTSYNKPGTKGVLWCGGGQVIEALEAAGRAIADAS